MIENGKSQEVIMVDSVRCISLNYLGEEPIDQSKQEEIVNILLFTPLNSILKEFWYVMKQ